MIMMVHVLKTNGRVPVCGIGVALLVPVIARAAVATTTDNFDRFYETGLWVEPEVVVAQFHEEVLLTAVPMIKPPRVRALRLTVHRLGPPDAGTSSFELGDDWEDLKEPLEDFLAQWLDKERWPVSEPEATALSVRMDVLRDFVGAIE